MKTSKTGFFLLFVALGMLPGAQGQTLDEAARHHVAVAYPNSTTPRATDLGALEAQSGTTPISVTVALSLSDSSGAESLLRAVSTPGNPLFHHFLTAEQFAPRFAPSTASVAKVIASFAKYGLTASQTSATTLEVTGLPAEMERAFSVSLHNYLVPAHSGIAASTFHAPLSRPMIPDEISSLVSAVVGLDSRPSFRPLYQAAANPMPRPRAAASSGSTANPPGYLTVTDFANHYDVDPLYSRGVSGNGRTIGILTLASFTPSDAFAYWSALGLSVDASRIRIVNVDGGPGAPSDASGSFETTVDVEQSGGIAPGAKIIVYQAPNTNQGFVDLFATAIDANAAESLSISWGSWEWFNNFENSPVTDPTTRRTVGLTQAVHELLLRAGIQGQTLFSAAGDGGAYEANHDLGCLGPFSSAVPTSCSLTLSVEYPSSDTAITAAGGTTLAGTQEYCLNAACTPPYYVIPIPQERVWGWDYLDGLCAAEGAPNPIACGIFPGGTGGGVSVLFDEPSYQFGLAGVQRSQPGQIFRAGQFYESDGIGLFYALPQYFQGRNLPDVSFNSDPETGYIVYYTSSTSGFSEEPYWGGTSFVGPQLNGVSALLGQYLRGERLGLLNYSLYGLAAANRAYGGPNAPLHAISSGDNWFYYGRNGYSPAAGLGTLDVANFAEYLRDPF
ncbi:MAG: S53 family peptidase [Candidatus Acidiferrum sp.]